MTQFENDPTQSLEIPGPITSQAEDAALEARTNTLEAIRNFPRRHPRISVLAVSVLGGGMVGGELALADNTRKETSYTSEQFLATAASKFIPSSAVSSNEISVSRIQLSSSQAVISGKCI